MDNIQMNEGKESQASAPSEEGKLLDAARGLEQITLVSGSYVKNCERKFRIFGYDDDDYVVLQGCTDDVNLVSDEELSLGEIVRMHLRCQFGQLDDDGTLKTSCLLGFNNDGGKTLQSQNDDGIEKTSMGFELGTRICPYHKRASRLSCVDDVYVQKKNARCLMKGCSLFVPIDDYLVDPFGWYQIAVVMKGKWERQAGIADMMMSGFDTIVGAGKYVLDGIKSMMSSFTKMARAINFVDKFITLVEVATVCAVSFLCIKLVLCLSNKGIEFLYSVLCFVQKCVEGTASLVIDCVKAGFRMFCSSGVKSELQDGKDKATLEKQGVGSLVAIAAGSLAFLAPNTPVGKTISLSGRLKEAALIVGPLAAATMIVGDASGYVLSWLPKCVKQFMIRMCGIGNVCCNASTQEAISEAVKIIDDWIQLKQEGKGFEISLARRTVATYRKLNNLRAIDHQLIRSPTALNLLNGMIGDLKTVADQCSVALGAGALRVVPVGVMINGPPGIGKSTIVTSILNAVFADVAPEERQFNYNPSESFQTGYRSSKRAVVCDDADAVGDKEFYALMIRWLSCAPVSVCMADIASKGEQMLSKMVINSTNSEPTANINGIRCVSAFRRRFLYVTASLAPGFEKYYKENNFDPPMGMDLANFEHLRFKLGTFSGDTFVSKAGYVDFEQLCFILKTKVDKNEYNFMRLLQLNRERKIDFVEFRKQVEEKLNEELKEAPNPILLKAIEDSIMLENMKVREEKVLEKQMAGEHVVAPCEWTDVVKKQVGKLSSKRQQEGEFLLELIKEIPNSTAKKNVGFMMWDAEFETDMSLADAAERLLECKERKFVELVNEPVRDVGFQKYMNSKFKRVESKEYIVDRIVEGKMEYFQLTKGFAFSGWDLSSCEVILAVSKIFSYALNKMFAYGEKLSAKEAEFTESMVGLLSQAYALDTLVAHYQGKVCFGIGRPETASDPRYKDSYTGRLLCLFVNMGLGTVKVVVEQCHGESALVDAVKTAQFLDANKAELEAMIEIQAVEKYASLSNKGKRFSKWVWNGLVSGITDGEIKWHGVPVKMTAAIVTATVLPIVVACSIVKCCIKMTTVFQKVKTQGSGGFYNDDDPNDGYDENGHRFVRGMDREAQKEEKWMRRGDSRVERMAHAYETFHGGDQDDGRGFYKHGEFSKQGMDLITTQESEVLSKVMLNCVVVVLTDRRGYRQKIRGLGVVGGFVLFPRHLIMIDTGEGPVKFPEGSSIEVFDVRLKDGKVTYLVRFQSWFDNSKIFAWGEKDGPKMDQVMYDFGLVGKPFADLRPHISCDGFQKKTSVGEFLFVNEEMILATQAKVNLHKHFYHESEDLAKELYVQGYWSYPVKTKKGDCGSLLMSRSPEVKIFGMHVAYMSTREFCGYSTRVIIEDIERHIGKVVKQVGFPDVEDYGAKPLEGGVLGHARLIGFAEQARPIADGVSAYQPSAYQDEDWSLKGKYFPPIMGVKHSVVPGVSAPHLIGSGIQRLCGSSLALDDVAVSLAGSQIFEQFYVTKPLWCRKLNIDESINGYDNIQKLPLKTAIGSWHNLAMKPGDVGKSWAIKGDPGVKKIVYAPLEEEIARFDCLLRDRKLPPAVWDVNMKDEVRSLEKIMAKNTRIIVTSPVSLTILFKKYFGAFVSHAIRNNRQMECAVGMNQYSADWDAMVQRELKISNVGIDGDYTSQETYLQPQIMVDFHKNVELWYEKYDEEYDAGDANARLALLLSVSFAVLRFGKLLFRKTGSNCSGNWLTLIINSFLVSYHYRVAWQELGEEMDPKNRHLSAFKTNVSLKTMGDDNRAAITERVLPWFNGVTLGEWMSRYGIVYTNASKEAVFASKPVVELSFLKCTSRKGDEIAGIEYYPVTEDKALHKSLLYFKKGANTKIQSAVIVGNVTLRRAWGGGVDVFNMWRNRIAQVFQKLRVEETPVTWADVKSEWEDGGLQLENDGYASLWVIQGGLEKQMEAGVAMLHPEEVITDIGKVSLTSEETKKPAEPTTNVVKRMPHVMDAAKKMMKVHQTADPADDFKSSLEFPVSSFLGQVKTGDMTEFTYAAFVAGAYRTWWGPIRYKFADCNKLAEGDPDVLSAIYSMDNVMSREFFRAVNTTGVIKTAPVAYATKVLQVHQPCTTRFSMNIIPLFESEIGQEKCGLGTMSFVSGNRPKVLHWGFCDGARFGSYCRIPRVKITGSLYPHYGGSAFDIAEFIKINSGALVVAWSQPLLDSLTMNSSTVLPSLTTVANATEFKFSTSSAGDSFLRSLGYAITDGQPRNVLTGTTDTKGCKITSISSVPGTWNVTTPTDTPVDGVYRFYAETLGTAYQITDDLGRVINICAAFKYQRQNLNNQAFRANVGLPPGNLVVWNNKTGYNAMDATATIVNQGYTYRIWSAASTAFPFYSAFGGITPEEDMVVIHHPEEKKGKTIKQAGEEETKLSFREDAEMQLLKALNVYELSLVELHENEIQKTLSALTKSIHALRVSKGGHFYLQPLGLCKYCACCETCEVSAVCPNAPVKEERVITEKQSGTGAASHEIVQKPTTRKENIAMSMGDIAPDTFQMMSQPQIVDTPIWSLSQGSGFVLGAYNAPWDFIKVRAVQSAFERSIFWRGGVEVTFEAVSTCFMSGMLVAFWAPLMSSEQAQATYAGNFQSISVINHCKIVAGGAPNVTIRIPYFHPKSHLDIRTGGTGENLGTLVLMVWNPLGTGAESPVTQVQLTVRAKFVESDFAIHNPTATNVIDAYSGLSMQVRSYEKKIEKQGGVSSKVTNINVERIEGSSFDASQGGDRFEGGATDIKACDKPSYTGIPPKIQYNKIPYYVGDVGVEQNEFLGLGYPSQGPVKVSMTGSPEDEMDLNYLISKGSFVETVVWKTSNIVNDVLFTGSLGPGSEFYSAPLNTTIQPSAVTFWTMPYQFWRGDIVYGFEVISSAVHNGSLVVCSHYGFESAGLTVAEAMGQYSCTFPIKGGSTYFEVVFPWRSSTEWKLVNICSTANAKDKHMGECSLRVYTGLGYNENIASEVQINVFMRGENFELYGLNQNLIDFSPVSMGY